MLRTEKQKKNVPGHAGSDLSFCPLAAPSVVLHPSFFVSRQGIRHELQNHLRLGSQFSVHCHGKLYRHLPFVVSQCDGRGISSNGKALDKERIQWFQATYPAVLSQSFIDCNALEQAGFREVVHILGQTHKFKKRMKALILFLYRIHRLFSFKHSS